MKRNLVYAIIAVLVVLSIWGGNEKDPPPEHYRQDVASTVQEKDYITDQRLVVHFLDVGQADSILIELPNQEIMLIDAGNNDDGPMVEAYLTELGISTIHYLIGTHPHEDHIGGLDDIIKSFDIGTVYMPRVAHTTGTYQDVLQAIKDKGLKVKSARANLSIIDTSDLQIQMIAPVSSEYNDLNQYSAVIKISYYDQSFLFAGDAGWESEQEMMDSGMNLQADVIKVGHHGSRYSTSADFLQAVGPELAVITCGAGNDYNHPHRQTITRLSQADVQVLRTDQRGTIIISSDGKDLQVTTSR
ncbi:MAG: MBL fold metallo-hydrolase [Syntrophomonadaceae bacterium]|nr:MBL fold metallo-hydrolase [Syntrophomonadaceae bacterium]